MSRRIALLSTALFTVCLMSASMAWAQVTNLGVTPVSTGQLSVIHGIAYAARHDVYLMVYESPSGIQGRFVNASGATVGAAFSIASTAGIAYANKPMVAYSTDTADDVFFVMFSTDRGKQFDGPPSAYMQRVTFTGSGGALQGGPFLASDGVYEIPNDIVYNPVTRQFVAVWERVFSEGADVLLRFFNANGTAGSGIVNVSSANWSQGAAKAAVDWETNRIMISYQGVSPTSPPSPEVLGLWSKIVDGSNGALLTGLLTVQNGFTIEPIPVFIPERDGFVVAWTGFNPGRDVQARFVSSATGSVGSMPAGVYTISGSGRSEGAAMGMYDAISRRVLMAVQSSGGCPNDTCPYLDGAVLDAQGTPLSSFTGLSTVTPASNGGTFYPDVAVGEGGQLGISYTVNYFGDYVERVSMPAAATPGPVFGGGGGGGGGSTNVVASPSSLSFSIVKDGPAISGFSPQSVTVSFAESPVAWTATTVTPWLQVTNGTGNGNGSFSVTIINPSDVIGTQTSLSGSVLLTAPGAPNSPVTVPVSLTVSPAGAVITFQGRTAMAGPGLTVAHGIAYAARHDVYLMVYETSSGVQGRFVNTSGVTVGNAFTIASLSGIAYANKPMVAYSGDDAANDVFFVMFATDRGKAYDGPPSAYIQRVTFTGSGGALQGGPFLASDGAYEVPNDIVYNPIEKKFVAVWERVFSEGADVLLRFFNPNGTTSGSIVNVSNANWSQGAAKAAVDWERNRIMIAYQGVHPNSPPSPERLGLWAKIVDGSNGALLTGLLEVGSGFTIEPVPVFLPERDGFMVAWTGFTPGRDVQGRFVSSLAASTGNMPAGVYTISGSGRSEGAAMGMYDGMSRKVLMAVQSSGACPNDTCPFLDGAILDAMGAPLTIFTGLSTATPSTTGGTFYPDVAVGEGGQFGFSYTLNYNFDYVERVSLPLAAQAGPMCCDGPPVVPNTAGVSPTSLAFAVTKRGSQITGGTPKSVSVTFAASPIAWTATTAAPWLQVTNGSGNGAGSFSVTVINPQNVIGSQKVLTGSVVLTAVGAPNSPVTVPVTVNVFPVQQVNLDPDSITGDALAYLPSTGLWARLMAQPGGGFQEVIGSWSPDWTVASAEFNGDTLSDFFLFNETSGQWAKVINTGTTFTTQATGTWWNGWTRFVTDLDGDGISDLFVHDPATGTWFRCISTIAGFSYTQGGWSPGWEVHPMLLNSDAFGDLFLINRTTGRWFWVLGQADGSFAYPVTETWFPGWVLYPGDFNGDGVTDLLLHSEETGLYFVATTGVSGFVYASGGWNLGWKPHVADLDGDGADDLFLHDPAQGLWLELISNKAGGFVNAGGQSWALGWDIHVTDLNGDGRADFLLYNPVNGWWYQARNLVLGSFQYSNGTWLPGLTIVVQSPIR